MRCLVTGGAGFIGSHLVDHLLAQGHEVRVVDDLSSGLLANLPASLRPALAEGDVRDGAFLTGLCRSLRPEVVFHLAALSSVPRSLEVPAEVADVNLGGTLRVLEAARACGARRVVFASSSSVYGDAGRLPREESLPARPLSPYAASKAGAEAFLAAWHASFGLETVSLRYFNVYGPRQRADAAYAAVIPCFVERALAGRPLVIEGDGRQTRDFTYVGDVARATALAATAEGALRGPINVGAGTRTEIARLASLVASACGSDAPPERAPARAGDVRHAHADTARARERLGWTPRVALADGLARVIDAARAEAAPLT